MPAEEQPLEPSLPWRIASIVTIGVSGFLSRSFLLGANRLEVNGLDRFLAILDEREDVQGRKRGLITVSNHLCVIDDPLIWGVLPLRYHWAPNNLRWSLGSYDICFQNKAISLFFTLGQVLPTHRLAHSTHGGLFQPTMTQAIRLLSSAPFCHSAPSSLPSTAPSPSQYPNITDPFTTGALTYTTNTHDSFPAPSAYASRRHAWLHVFPEGKTHQHPDGTMRYFKWGVARLILEAEPCPDVVPVWIEGTEGVMHESREWPRWVPRGGRRVVVSFGEVVRGSGEGNGGEQGGEGGFGDLRARWRGLVEREREGKRKIGGGMEEGKVLGVLREEEDEELRVGEEAVALRMECAMRVREKVLEVRRNLGYKDEDPKARWVDTWREEGRGGREGKQEDGSWVRDV